MMVFYFTFQSLFWRNMCLAFVVSLPDWWAGVIDVFMSCVMTLYKCLLQDGVLACCILQGTQIKLPLWARQSSLCFGKLLGAHSGMLATLVLPCQNNDRTLQHFSLIMMFFGPVSEIQKWKTEIYLRGEKKKRCLSFSYRSYMTCLIKKRILSCLNVLLCACCCLMKKKMNRLVHENIIMPEEF